MMVEPKLRGNSIGGSKVANSTQMSEVSRNILEPNDNNLASDSSESGYQPYVKGNA